MIRPQAKAALWRWREVLAALPLAALGLIWSNSFGFARLAGLALLALAAVLTFTGIQRARFRRIEDGEGLVILSEDELTYMGPHTGGSLGLDQIACVRKHVSNWIIESETGTRLLIPLSARGAEQLFDVFAKLPGFSLAHATHAAGMQAAKPITLWRRRVPGIDSTNENAHLH